MRHVVLIGAARSGTKLVRDTLGHVTGAGVVPYDINFVWRYGNESSPDDALPATAVTPRSRRFVTKYIDGYGASGVVIEKTVSNSLRVPFVDQVLPGATYIHLIRDGADAVESTFQQWSAPPEGRYLREKLRHFPLRLAPTYGYKHAVSLATRRFGREDRVGSWGVRYEGIDADLRSGDLLTVCARQWRTCVEHSLEAFAALDLDVHEVRYEEFVADPLAVLERLCSALALPFDPARAQDRARGITTRNVGKGRERLDPRQYDRIAAEMDPTLTRIGYAPMNREGDAR